MKIGPHTIGICSWSLRASGIDELARICRELGISHVQLALNPLLDLEEGSRRDELSKLRDSTLKLTAGMIGFAGEDYSTIAAIRQTGGVMPDDQWTQRRDLAFRAIDLANELGLDKITTHLGFIPSSADARYATVVQRADEIATRCGESGIILTMETGQERANELLQFLNDLPAKNVGANFDPANMLLYGSGDPIEAIKVLGRHIHHVHVKDATVSDQPGIKWGNEVAFGSGQVDPRAFLGALREVGYEGPLVIEREAGETRIDDIRQAITVLQQATA